MELTRGQRLAVAQLERLQFVAPRLVRVGNLSTGALPDWVRVRLSMSTEGIRPSPDGFPIRARESFDIEVPPDFPRRIPEVLAAHDRWAGKPHVQWGQLVCLYLAPATQWHPSDGMFGLVERLVHWLQKAAVNELDPLGIPAHPPVAYAWEPDAPILVVRVDTPAPSTRLLFGKAVKRGDRRLEVVELDRASPEALEGPVLMVAITPNRLPIFEFPTKVGGLISALESLELPSEFIASRMLEAASLAPSGSPLILLLGSDCRDSETGMCTDHFVAWRIDDETVGHMRIVKTADGSSPTAEAAYAALDEWLDEPVDYCVVEDARPQVSVRRDEGTPAAAFRGLTVEVWGCGALGGWMAEYLLRAGATRLVVRDNGRVRPGLLVRQPYGDPDVTHLKASALADRLKEAFPEADVSARTLNVISDVPPDSLPAVDLIIDATASRIVQSHLETVLSRQLVKDPEGARPVLASVMTDLSAQRLFVTAVAPRYSGGPTDVARKTHLTLQERPRSAHFREAFWPDQSPETLFRPEPGCSDATFYGSAANAAALAGEAVSLIGTGLPKLREGSHAISRLVVLPHAVVSPMNVARRVQLSFDADRLLHDESTAYQVRLAAEAEEVIRATASASVVERGHSQPETGGLLFGERDDAAAVVWVTAATPPPPDSRATNLEFICGTAGTHAQNEQLRQASDDSVHYVGMWHTHPGHAPTPSSRDRETMAAQEEEGVGSVFLIAGGDLVDPDLAVCVTGLTGSELPASSGDEQVEPPAMNEGSSASPARDASPTALTPATDDHPREPMPLVSSAIGTGLEVPAPCEEPLPAERAPLDPLPSFMRPIGLAFSGGGFRATLAALGVLRYLSDAGLLGRVRMVSSVSGGSVANGVFAARYAELRDEHFAPGAVDELVVRPTLALISQGSLTAMVIRNMWRAAIPGRGRTHVLEHCLDRRFFKGRRLRDLPTGCWFMFNAANENTGARFRFDRDLAGDYVLGSVAVQQTELRVATAVAASAAVPGVFPPLVVDGLQFACGGTARLIDGGAYDNLGLEPFSRRPEMFLVAMNAGGLFRLSGRSPIPVVSGLRRANAVLYRQVSALRSRWLMEQFTAPSDNDSDRSGVLLNLAARFDDLDEQARGHLRDWKNVAPEPSTTARTWLAATPTTFGRIERQTAESLIYLAWWTAGAVLTAHHRWLLPERLPAWRPIDS